MTEQQWLTIYRDTIHSLYRFVAKRTGGNQELTEDIVQETYLRALESWKNKNEPGIPLAWLNRVARNLLIDYLRKRRGDHHGNLDGLFQGDSQKSRDQIQTLETFLTISSLGKKKARILEAFYFEGLSVKEIAKEKRISERAVEGHLRRARQVLKSVLPQFRSNGGHNE